MSIQKVLSSPLSKIKRANRHIDELRERTTPLDRSLYEITNRPERESVVHLKPSFYQVTYRPKENIPEVFAGIIGDCIGNLRAALDHLASGIVRTWGAPTEGPLYFPMAPRKNLVSHTGLTAIELALPGSKKLLLDEIRPERGPNEHLWDFYTLNKDDKHNFFIPTVTAVEISNINARIDGNYFLNNTIGSNAANPSILFRSGSPVSIGNAFYTSVEVKFGKGTVFENEPVIPTLTQISQVVAETLTAFERLMVKTKT